MLHLYKLYPYNLIRCRHIYMDKKSIQIYPNKCELYLKDIISNNRMF